MFTTFVLLVAGGFGSRLVLAWVLRRRFDRRLIIPQILATVLLVLSGLPDWLSPVPFPVPFGFVLGFVLPDLLIRRF